MTPTAPPAQQRQSAEARSPINHGRPALAGWRELLVVAVAALGLALLVERSYLTAGFVGDDIEHLDWQGRIAVGETGLAAHLLAPHNEHWLPLWKLWYHACWRWLGLNPFPWHLTITAVHASGAVALYLIVRHYTLSRAGAWTAALVWATTTFGSRDNPLVWIASSHFDFSAVAMLWAMAAVTAARRPHGAWAAPVMGAALAVGIGMMGTMLFLAPLVLLQYFWLERPNGPQRRDGVWLAAWLLPVAVVGYPQLELLVTVVPQKTAVGVPIYPHHVLGRTLAQMAAALGNLAFRDQQRAAGEGLVWHGVLGAVLLGQLMLAGGRPFRALLIVLAMALVFTMIVHVGRRELHLGAAISWGRYNVLPSIVWAAALGMLVAALEAQWPRARRLVWGLAGLYLALAVWHQDALAAVARASFDELARHTQERLAPYRGLVDQLAQEGRVGGRAVRVWDLPIPSYPTYTRLSWHAAYREPRGIEGLEIVSARHVSRRDVERLLAIRQRAAPLPDPISDRFWPDTADLPALLLQLEARAQQDPRPLELPDFEIRVGEKPFSLARAAAILFPEGLAAVEWVAPDALTLDQIQRLSQVLLACDTPRSRDWLEQLRLLRTELETLTNRGASRFPSPDELPLEPRP